MEHDDDIENIGYFSDEDSWTEESEEGSAPSPSALPFLDQRPFPETVMSSQTPSSSRKPINYKPKINRPPPAGHRVPLEHGTPFPGESITGPPPFRLPDGSPVFIGSGIMGTSVHPCKVIPTRSPACIIPYAGGEVEHLGRYDLLPFDPETMEWVPARYGRVPPGRIAIEGGYEDHGIRLYHALVIHNGIPIPCKAATHLRGANFGHAGFENVAQDNYQILCWRKTDQ